MREWENQMMCEKERRGKFLYRKQGKLNSYEECEEKREMKRMKKKKRRLVTVGKNEEAGTHLMAKL